MTLREIFLRIGYFFDTTLSNWILEFWGVLLLQKNWLDASLSAVFAASALYVWGGCKIYLFISGQIEHGRRYREEPEFRREWDEKVEAASRLERAIKEEKSKSLADAPLYKKLYENHPIATGIVAYVLICISLLAIIIISSPY
jgi:hypothetical protein